MKLSKLVIAAAVVAAGATSLSTSALAQAKEQFFPLLSYRTGPYAPNGTPWANGKQDYIKMINARDGGINGVKLTFEECETGYATDRGVECYERLKTRPGVSFFDPQATGITFALTEKAPIDKIPLMTLGYGLSVAQDGMAFKWNFPLMGSYWTGADVLHIMVGACPPNSVHHLARVAGGLCFAHGRWGHHACRPQQNVVRSVLANLQPGRFLLHARGGHRQQHQLETILRSAFLQQRNGFFAVG